VSERDEEAQEILSRIAPDGRVLNIYATFVRHPKLLKRWAVFGGHILNQSSLPPRERELLVLRTCWLCQAEYEFSQHVLIARKSGVSEEDIARTREGPDVEGWQAPDRVLLRAADELLDDAFIGDDTWRALSGRLDTKQLIDLIFTVGEYKMISMALNTLGVQLEDDVPGFAEKR
jgi:alkylhydroperoxidase family enzyme